MPDCIHGLCGPPSNPLRPLRGGGYQLTPRLREALAAYEVALTRDPGFPRPFAHYSFVQYTALGKAIGWAHLEVAAAIEEIHRATYVAQGAPLVDADIHKPDDDPFWIARMAIREAVDKAVLAIETKVAGNTNEDAHV